MYCSNLDYGQRKVAKATRCRFKLEKFSHSTVCRSFKRIEQFQKQELERRFGKEFKANNDNNQTPTQIPTGMFTKDQEEPCVVRRFPSAEDTVERRDEIAIFLQSFHKATTKEDSIEAAGQIFVKYWYEKTKRLLI
jgi:hypothetical protein